jgi:hypothetical protein
MNAENLLISRVTAKSPPNFLCDGIGKVLIYRTEKE